METYSKLNKPADGTIKPIVVKTECTAEEEEQGLLQVIYANGKFYNQITLDEIRAKVNEL